MRDNDLLKGNCDDDGDDDDDESHNTGCIRLVLPAAIMSLTYRYISLRYSVESYPSIRSRA